MLDETARGVFTIAATPFLPDGALDEASLDSMTDFYMEKGATGLTILGIMGEAGKLSAEESARVIEKVCARAKVPVIVGVSAPGFAAIEAMSEQETAKILQGPTGAVQPTDSPAGQSVPDADSPLESSGSRSGNPSRAGRRHPMYRGSPTGRGAGTRR